MKRTLSYMMLFTICALLLSAASMAQMHDNNQHHEMTTVTENEVVCPVTNRIMNTAEAPASYTFYFASEAAKDVFLKNPAKFLTATCPVIGGEASKLTAAYTNYEGVAYFFCCDGCQEKFDKEPKAYIGKAPQKSEAPGGSESPVMGAKASGQTCGASESGHTCGAASASCAATCPAMKAKVNLVSDPVCGMQFAAEDGMKLKHDGTEYHFCSEQCRLKFEKDPDAYSKK
jgi:YHS domain-containing protein